MEGLETRITGVAGTTGPQSKVLPTIASPERWFVPAAHHRRAKVREPGTDHTPAPYAGDLPSPHDPCTARRGRRVHLGAAGPRPAPGRLRGRGARGRTHRARRRNAGRRRPGRAGPG